MIHNPYDKGFKTLRQAANVIVLTNNLRNLRHAAAMSREIFCYKGNLIYKILHKLCSQPNYDQLLVNLQNNTPHQLMIQSGLIPPNVRRIYNHDSQNREGFRSGNLLKDGNQLNTVINNRITQESSNKNTDKRHNSLIDNNEPIKNTENISNKNKKSEGDVTEESKKITPENELFPGVEYSPDMLRAMNKTKENKNIPEATQETPVIKQEDKEINNVSSQSGPQEMSIDYNNSTRRDIQPESIWMETINELGSDSTTGATKGSESGQYSALTNSNVSSASATAGSTIKQQDTSSGSPQADVLDNTSNNSERDFTKILSDTIINKPLTTTSKSTETSADSVMQDILGAKTVSTINEKNTPSSVGHPQSKDIMNETTQPVIETSSQDIKNQPIRNVIKPEPSIYDERYVHSRDDSYLPNWTRRNDVSLTLPQIKALFQPRIYSSPREGKRWFTSISFYTSLHHLNHRIADGIFLYFIAFHS